MRLAVQSRARWGMYFLVDRRPAEPRRRTRDLRTLTSGLGSIDFDYRELTTSDWLFIEQKLNAKIPRKLRGQLSALTMLYLIASYTPHREVSISKVRKDIDLWADRTRDLRKSIWSGVQSKPAPTNLKKIMGEYFHLRQGFHSGLFPLAHLAQLLDGAEAIGRFFSTTFQSTKTTASKTTELWLIWAAVVIALCRSNRISIEQKQKKGLRAGFLLLLDRLQATLTASDIDFPTDISRAKNKALPKPSIKMGESLQKSARQALKVAEENPVNDLAWQLIFRSTGWLQFGEGKTTLEQQMADLQSLLEVQATLRRRPARTA